MSMFTALRPPTGSPTGSSAGFTLIELLVSLTILLLLVGGGIATFVRFNDRQTLLGAAKELQIALRAAQQKAQVMDKPEGCDTLEGYQVSAPIAAPVQVSLIANCTGGDVLRETITLPASISLSSALSVTFHVLQGGIDVASTTITLVGPTGQEYQFSMSRGGEIGEGAFIEQ